MALIFITRRIPEAGITALINAGHEVVVSEKDDALTPDELQAALAARPYDALVTLLSDTINASVLSVAPQVRIVANYAVGYNNIAVEELHTQGIVVTNTPGVLTNSVAEFTIALMMALVKRIPEADRFTRAGKFTGWASELLLGSDVAGKTLGLVGVGRIGSEVAKRASLGLGMNVRYYDVARSEVAEAASSCSYCEDIDTLLAESDVVSIHVPLLPTTQHLIDGRRLSLMKRSAYLINTSRGPIIDETALVHALQTGIIRGAALDVFEREPELTPGLASIENVILAPHIASASEETRTAMALMVADNINTFLSGGEPAQKVG